MPSAFLYDWTNIDLNAVALTPEEVGRMNPQAGHMRQIDYLIWHSEDRCEGLGVKHVREDEFWVPGHIPGRPLLPGVLMIEAAAQVCSLLYKLKSPEPRFIGFTRCDDVAFRDQVVPGDTLYVLTKEVSYRPKRFISKAQGVVNGRQAFEATITGMVM
ncbi:MAG TPA: hypothetical protein VG711_04115 [Phycisphaerales bacterium]|nr:hypothetical protein [Phycisphaerales bacterium]